MDVLGSGSKLFSWTCLASLLTVACGGGGGSGADGTWGGDGSTSDGAGADGASADGGDGAPSDGASGDGAPADGTPADGGDGSPADPVRFIVIGDGGTGDDAQKKVAAAIRDVCAQRGCDFAIYMGDNIYEKGATAADDAIFQTNFEEPYAELDFPFYVALGNHDYGGEFLGGVIPGGSNLPGTIHPERAQAQLDYALGSDKWIMPASYYTFRKGPVAFFVLDTNSIVVNDDALRPLSEQQAWLDAQIAESDAPWKIVYGHHPYVSNGEHGNAGDYRAIEVGGIALEPHNGATLKSLVEESVCGKANFYMSGHDHDREWLDACNMSFIVSGAAAKLDPIKGRGSEARWSDDTKRGFMWAEIDGDTFTGVFYDDDGAMNYEDTVMR